MCRRLAIRSAKPQNWPTSEPRRQSTVWELAIIDHDARKPPLLDRHHAQELDRRAVAEYGLPSIVLMENAGRGVADTLCRLGIDGTVAVCCGGGNNGGDGFVVARHLELRGFAVKVFAWADPARLTGDAAVNFEAIRRGGLPIVLSPPIDQLAADLRRSDWIVDALLGTGARGEVRPPLAEVIETMNAVAARRLAVDLPSGLDCDTGRPSRHTVRAQHTCTFVAQKRGFAAPQAAEYIGEVHVLDIGAPRKLVDEILEAAAASGP